MRILFVTPYVPSPIRVRPYHFVQELARRHEVVVLSLWQGERERGDLAALRRLVPVVGVWLPRLDALLNCARALPGSVPLQAAYCRSRPFERLLRAALTQGGEELDLPPELREPFDVVHVEHLRAAYLGEAIPRMMPSVVDAVDCISLLLSRTRRSSHRGRQRLLAALELPRTRRFEAEAMARFDEVAVTSPADAAALRRLNPALRVSEIANGVDLTYFQLDPRPRDPETIVFTGKMSYHANATAALYFAREVLPRIRARRPGVTFHIVGSDPPAEIRALARAPGVVVTGHVPDLRPYLSQASIAVAPMVVKVGIQNKILEAMAVGTPVVTTSLGAEGLAAVDGCDLEVADGAEAFAARVLWLLDDPERLWRLRDAGRRYVEERHTWVAAARRLEDLYASAVAAHDRAGRLAAGRPVEAGHTLGLVEGGASERPEVDAVEGELVLDEQRCGIEPSWGRAVEDEVTELV